MKKLLKILISGIVAIIALGGFANIAFAELPPLVVQFQNTPLFEGADIVPGDGMSRTVQVTNNTSGTETIITTASNFNFCASNCLADALTLTITDESQSYFSGTLRNFYNAGEVELGALGGNGGSKIFTYTIFFPTDSGNDFQNKSTSFDLVVGFKGGETTSDGSTFIAVGGGGGSGGSRHLFIFNERNETPLPDTTAVTVYWETNIPATSQVIYGPASGNYVLDLNNLPYLGYPLGTDENTVEVIDHMMVISGLVSGQTYKYRVVSRASPPTISYEHQFTVPASQTGNIITSGSLGISEGEILGASSENNEAASTSNESNLAAAITGGWSDLISLCSLIALLILLIGYIIWRFIFRPRYEFSIFFGLFSALAIVIAFLLGQYCPIPIFLIALLISAGLYVYYKLQSL